MFLGGLVLNYPIMWSNLYSRLFFIVICFSFYACKEFIGCDNERTWTMCMEAFHMILYNKLVS
jgi:hypothetical protein